MDMYGSREIFIVKFLNEQKSVPVGEPFPAAVYHRISGVYYGFFLCVLGMVMIVEGLPYFAFPESTKSWVRKIIEIPVGSLRKIGFILMIVGLLLVYIGKR